MLDRKRLAFGAVLGAILVAVTLAGMEFLASFYTPSWPARAMKPRAPAPERVLASSCSCAMCRATWRPTQATVR